jgi:RimJ/RimL family protein N-acetyltransferase
MTEPINPILIDIPTRIETPRLILRAAQVGDGRELNEGIVETYDSLRLWIPWAAKLPTPEESENWIRQICAKWFLREALAFIMIEKESGKMLGSSSLHRIDWNIPSFEIGWWIRKSFEGRGLISETTNALTRLAFQQLKAKRVTLVCDPHNKRSVSSIERLGFEREAHLKKNVMKNDLSEVRDTYIYVRFNTEGLPPLVTRW